jgi:hypothetical protein
VKASTASELGFQNRELNLSVLRFIILANLSIECAPHKSSMNEKNSSETNCVKILRSGSMKEQLHKLTFSIFSLCLQRCIYIDIQWIPRSENSKADYISIYND